MIFLNNYILDIVILNNEKYTYCDNFEQLYFRYVSLYFTITSLNWTMPAQQ